MPIENEEVLRERFARNLTHYRKTLGLTQIELAEKLNYSDKSISKWERGDGLPDLSVTVQLAEIFGLTVNDLIAEKPRKRLLNKRNKAIITLLSIGLAWLVVTVLFFLFENILPNAYEWWKLYIFVVPAGSIIAIVFAYLWWKKTHQFLSVSSLVWSIAVCLQLAVPIEKMHLIFIVAAVLQILVVLWFLIKNNKQA